MAGVNWGAYSGAFDAAKQQNPNRSQELDALKTWNPGPGNWAVPDAANLIPGLRDELSAYRDPIQQQQENAYRDARTSQGLKTDATSANVIQAMDANAGKGPPQSAMSQWTGVGSALNGIAGGGGGGVYDPMSSQRSELYNMLLGRAKQGLNIDRNDPIIRAQSDAYNANEERARRNYLADTAEQSGPYANLQGEARMASERMGQRTGAFESELLGRELTARRQEIADALSGAAGLISDSERLELQRQLAMYDNALQQQSLNSQNDRFAAQLGFDYADRSNYYDLLRRGLA